MSGFFVSFEGIEHCGKTTQSRKLAERLTADGHEVVLTREPGGTPMGVAVRELLLHESVGHVDPVAELLLFAADRAQHVRTLILPALEADKVVISDRFFDSTRAYQGSGRQLSMNLIDRAISLATSGLEPDLTVLVDIDVPTSRARAEKGVDDRIEQSENAFFDRVRAGFLAIAKGSPNRFLVVDGTNTIEAVSHQIAEEVSSQMQGT